MRGVGAIVVGAPVDPTGVVPEDDKVVVVVAEANVVVAEAKVVCAVKVFEVVAVNDVVTVVDVVDVGASVVVAGGLEVEVHASRLSGGQLGELPVQNSVGSHTPLSVLLRQATVGRRNAPFAQVPSSAQADGPRHASSAVAQKAPVRTSGGRQALEEPLQNGGL